MELDEFCASTDWGPEFEGAFWALLAKSRKRADTKTRVVMQKVATLRRYRMPMEQRRPEEVVGLLREARARGLFPDEPSLTESLHQEGEALLEGGSPTEALQLWERAYAPTTVAGRTLRG